MKTACKALSAGPLHICRRGVLVLFSFVLIDQQREIPEHSTLKVFHLTTAKGLSQLYCLDVFCMADKWEAAEWQTCSLLLCLPHTCVSWRLILLSLSASRLWWRPYPCHRTDNWRENMKQEISWYTSLPYSFQVFRDCVKDQEAKRKERCDLVDWALETQQWLIKVVSHEYPSTETILWSQ